MTDTSALRTMVFEALENAVANGYSEFARKKNVVAVAIDIKNGDAEVAQELERLELMFVDLVPHIQAWRKQIS